MSILASGSMAASSLIKGVWNKKSPLKYSEIIRTDLTFLRSRFFLFLRKTTLLKPDIKFLTDLLKFKTNPLIIYTLNILISLLKSNLLFIIASLPDLKNFSKLLIINFLVL